MAVEEVGAPQTYREDLIASGIAIRTEDLWKTYEMGAEHLHALRGVSIEIRRGEYVAIMGPSGSGKSTLMNLIGCLDTPSKGRYWLAGRLVSELNDDELAYIRNKEIGFVFQTFNLLPRATALHNVELPMIYNGTPSEERQERAKKALAQVDLADRMMHKPNELSGGQRQRVAIARSMVLEPTLLLLDEIAGGLTPHECEDLVRAILSVRATGVSIIWIEHVVHALLAIVDRLMVLHQGRKLMDGEPHAVMASREVHEIYLGVEADG